MESSQTTTVTVNTSSVSKSRSRHQEKLKEEIAANPYPIRYVEFMACRELYAKYSVQGATKPVDGVKMNVAYIDTNPKANQTTPVIVCLHGCPGGHWDFNHLTIHLAKKGYRIVIPNFPGYGWTDLDENREFQNTPAEMANFVKDFLSTLGIDKVHMGIVHSSGVYSGILLSSEMHVFQSMALINPGGLGYVKVLQPYSLWRYCCHYYKNPIFRPFLFVFMRIFMLVIQMGIPNTEQMSTALETLVFVPYEELKNHVIAMAAQKFPSVFIHSLNDRVVQTERSMELGDLLAGSEEHLKFVYENGLSSPNQDTNKQITHSEHHIFNSGGHFVMKKYPDVVNEIISKFLNKVDCKMPSMARL